MASTLTQPTPITIPWASLGNKRVIPTDSQILVAGGDGKASYPDGYPPLCGTPLVSGGKPPSILDENGILFDITNNLRFLLGGGSPRFNSAMASAIGGYPVGAILQDNDGVTSYINVLDGNTTDFNVTPASIGVSWFNTTTGRPGHTYTDNDWTPIGGGLILQWGQVTLSGVVRQKFLLPTSFFAKFIIGIACDLASTDVSPSVSVGTGSTISQIEVCSTTPTTSVINFICLGV